MTWNKILPAAVAAAFLMSAGVANANEDGSKSQEQAGTMPSEESSTTESASALPESEMRTLTLTVTGVDRAENKVQFEAQVDPEATVKRGSEELRINQLQPGDSVRASFDPTTGEVQSMEVIEQIPGAQEPGMQPPSSTEPTPTPGMEEPMEEPGLGEPSY